MYIVSIPKISKEELIARYKRIKPIVEFEGKKYFLREFSTAELTGKSYIWNISEDKREHVDMKKFIPLVNSDFECLHSYGYYGVFKPSIGEVLAQIPKIDADFVDAFEIIEQPEVLEDFNKYRIQFDNGFHVSKVRLYMLK